MLRSSNTLASQKLRRLVGRDQNGQCMPRDHFLGVQLGKIDTAAD